MWERGHEVVVGIDEVGRGAWAGPLIGRRSDLAARHPGQQGPRLQAADRGEREALFDRIDRLVRGLVCRIRLPGECDHLGMSAAQKLAARRAIEGLGVAPDVAVTDGTWDFVSPAVPHVELAVKADLRCLSVATASILAKVVRDREMRAHAESYPHWSFDTNKGYPCPVHKAALLGYGPSAIHRRSWVFMDHYVPWTAIRRTPPAGQSSLF